MLLPLLIYFYIIYQYYINVRSITLQYIHLKLLCCLLNSKCFIRSRHRLIKVQKKKLVTFPFPQNLSIRVIIKLLMRLIMAFHFCLEVCTYIQKIYFEKCRKIKCSLYVRTRTMYTVQYLFFLLCALQYLLKPSLQPIVTFWSNQQRHEL